MLSPVEALTRHFELPQQPAAKSEVAQHQASQHGVVIGNIGLLLASERMVSEIFETLPQCELPNAPAWVHSMANQRGNIIPVFDLALLLGLPKTETKHPYYLVIGQNEDAFGMLLERLPEKVSLSPDDRLDNQPPVPEVLEPFVGRGYEKEGRIWLEWDPEAFVAAMTTRA